MTGKWPFKQMATEITCVLLSRSKTYVLFELSLHLLDSDALHSMTTPCCAWELLAV